MRESDATVSYSEARDYPDSCIISGSYQLDVNVIDLTMNIVSNNIHLGKKINLRGDITNIEPLVENIISTAFREVFISPVATTDKLTQR